MTPEARRAEGRTLSRVLIQKIPKGSTICGYFPLKSEVDIQLLLKEMIDRGDTIFLPVFDKKNTKMIYRKAHSLADLPPGEFTIPEPPENRTRRHVYHRGFDGSPATRSSVKIQNSD